MLVDRVVAMESGKVTLECEPSDLASRLGLRSWLHLVVGDDNTDAAAAALAGKGLTVRADRHGVLVEVGAQEKGLALGTLHDAGIDVVDLEVWR